jgi:hypothetical protein
VDAGSSSRVDANNKNAPVWVAAVVVFVALAVGVVVVLVTRGGDDASESASTTTPAVQVTELSLEPAGAAGVDPFSASVAIYEKPLASDATLASTPRVEGNQPGLYGGTQDQKVCDADALIAFLEQNPDKAAAWAGALDITPAAIGDYVNGLTPVVLRTDTRVTNHGFADGVATPRQSVLEAGTAVFVDAYGVPRVRCSCGNPLTEPAPLGALPTALAGDTVTLVGQPWASWNPQLVVIVNGTVIVNQFIVWDLDNGGTFPIEIGGAPVTTTTTQPPTTTTTRPPTTTTTAPPTDLCNQGGESDEPFDPETYEESGDVVCDPATGETLCYVGPNLVPCGRD